MARPAENNHADEREQRNQSFCGQLNAHGWPFQAAVTELARKLNQSQKSRWHLVESEIPVVGHRESKIDLVLAAPNTRRGGCYLICECKRADPQFSNWFFFRMPTDHNLAVFYADYLGTPSARMVTLPSTPTFDGGIVVKVRDHKSDISSRQREAINESVTQALSGSMGLYKHWLRHGLDCDHYPNMTLIPVVFTTARLFCTEAELALAPIETGKLSTIDHTEAPYLIFQYRLSDSFRPEINSGKDPWNLRRFVELNYLRSVYIVSAASIETFLTTLNDDFFAAMDAIPQ
jgi:hypothetical protein